MKTDKKSLVPLFTFPPPLLAALFLLAGCHYKALQGMVWAIGVGHRARWRSPMFQTPWHAHTFAHTFWAVSVTCARRCTQGHTHLYICAKKLIKKQKKQRGKHRHWTYVYTVHTHMDVLHTNKRMWTNTQHAHSYLKEHAYKHAQMRARTHTHTHTHVHTGFRRNTGTHRKSSKVIQCRK